MLIHNAAIQSKKDEPIHVQVLFLIPGKKELSEPMVSVLRLTLMI